MATNKSTKSNSNNSNKSKSNSNSNNSNNSKSKSNNSNSNSKPKSPTKKANSSNHTGIMHWCLKCENTVDMHNVKEISFKGKGGKTRKRLSGECAKGHKMSKFIKSD
jgi:hypothetical protein